MSSMDQRGDPHAVLGVAPGAEPHVVDQALEIKLLGIPNTRCPAANLYYGGATREEESCCYPVDDMVEFEKLKSASYVLTSHMKRAYDEALQEDPHPLGQLRTTQRAMYSMRQDVRAVPGRLAELREALLRVKTAAEADGLRDEMRYLLRQMVGAFDSAQACPEEISRLRGQHVQKRTKRRFRKWFSDNQQKHPYI